MSSVRGPKLETSLHVIQLGHTTINWLPNTLHQIQATAGDLESFETAFREIHQKVCKEAGGTMVTDDTYDDERASPPCMFQSGRIHFMLDMTPFFI